MNTKTIAILMSLTMVLAATAVVLVDDSDAADKGSVYVKVNHTTTVNFVITEPDDDYYKNTVDWKIGQTSIYDSNASKVPANIDSSGAVAGSGGTAVATIEITGSGGTYSATITGVTKTSSEVPVTVVYTIGTTEKNTDGATGTVTQSISYNIALNVIGTPFDDQTNDLPNAQYGLYMDPKSIKTNLDTTNFVYYAIGLPEGMQLTPDGKISGTPLADDMNTEVKDKQITVIATHKASNQTFLKTYYMDIAVEDSDEFGYTVSGAQEIVGGSDRYMVVQNGSVTVEITKDIEDAWIIDSNGERQDLLTRPAKSFTITPGGSGSFTVVMVNGNYDASFELVVVAITQDVTTGIGFAPNTPVSP